MAVPLARVLPLIRLTSASSSSSSKAASERLVVRIDSWRVDQRKYNKCSTFDERDTTEQRCKNRSLLKTESPHGHVVRRLGAIGSLETELAALLIEVHYCGVVSVD
jgi:hypothetical protein